MHGNKFPSLLYDIGHLFTLVTRSICDLEVFLSKHFMISGPSRHNKHVRTHICWRDVISSLIIITLEVSASFERVALVLFLDSWMIGCILIFGVDLLIFGAILWSNGWKSCMLSCKCTYCLIYIFYV